MQYDQFIGQVQSRARLPSQGEAERAAEATLATLAERLAGGEAQHLTAQLPEELARRVRAGAGETAEKFDVREFFRRVAQREGVEPPTAAFHARAVVEVWCEAVTEGQVRDVRNQLPGEFAPLFEAGREGKMA